MTHDLKGTTLGGFVALLVLLLFGSVYGIYQLHSAHLQLEQIVAVNNYKIALATEMQVAGFRRQNYLYNMLLVDDPFLRDEMFMDFNREGFMVGKGRSLLREFGMGAQEQAIFDHQSRLIEDVVAAQERVVELATGGEIDEARGLMLFEALPAQTLNNHTFQEMRELQAQLSQSVVESANRSYRQTIWLTIVLSLTGLLLGGVIAAFSYRRTAHHAEHLHNNIKVLADSFSELEGRAKSDPLTGLPNRAALLEHLRQVATTRSEEGGEYAVMFFDLDNFKPVNDLLGHDAGDELLGKVAGRVLHALRREDLLARLGGDEFVAVLGLESALEQSGPIAAKVIESLARPFSLEAGTVAIGVSIGIACSPLHGNDPEQLLKRADEAMYEAKRDGRNRYSHYRGGGKAGAGAVAQGAPCCMHAG